MQRFHSNAMRIRRMTMIGLFTALAYVVMMLIHFPVPPMLTLDLKDTVITLCGLCFGPLAAVFAGIVVPLLELITVSDTGVYGFVMNALGALSFSVTVSLQRTLRLLSSPAKTVFLKSASVVKVILIPRSFSAFSEISSY